MIYKIRVILDTKEDVIRTLLVNPTITLEEFHQIIAKVFGFNGQEMASFFRSDDQWNPGEEIPLCTMEDASDALCMSTTTLAQNIEDPEEKLIYVYDYLNMWTFYCELVEVIASTDAELPKLVLSIGETPEKAPEKEFKADKSKDSFDFDDDDFDTDYDEFKDFDSLEDLDLNNY